MLQKVYVKGVGRKPALIYVESKNFDFNPNRVFNINLEQIKINDKLFQRICDMIIHKLHYPSDDIASFDEYDIALGRLIKTPEELL